jgi:osmoprotectant transport system substrate-binding protein
MIRARALGLIAAAAALPACAPRSAVSVGSKNFTEQLILGEMYAQILERDGITVGRKLDLGGTQIAMAALRKGEIDLYPEYTGTALLTVLHLPAQSDGAAIYQTVKREYQRQFDLTWLAPAPMNDTQALATTQAIAQRYDMRTLSKLSTVAPQLRLGAIPEFTTREDGLPGLQRAYGGFHFKEVRLFDIGLKYKALLTGNVDVVVAFGTDGQIAADDLVVLEDDRHFWPVYQVAPVVRDETLRAYPKIAPSLDALAPLLTDATMRHLNDQVDGRKLEPADVARAFLRSHNLA